MIQNDKIARFEDSIHNCIRRSDIGYRNGKANLGQICADKHDINIDDQSYSPDNKIIDKAKRSFWKLLNDASESLTRFVSAQLDKNKGWLIALGVAFIFSLIFGYRWTILMSFALISIILDLMIHLFHIPIHFNTYLFFAILIAKSWGFTPYAFIFLIITGPLPEMLGANTKISDYLLLFWTGTLTYLAVLLPINAIVYGVFAAILEQVVNGLLQFFLGDLFGAFVDTSGQVIFNYVLFTKLGGLMLAIM